MLPMMTLDDNLFGYHLAKNYDTDEMETYLNNVKRTTLNLFSHFRYEEL